MLRIAFLNCKSKSEQGQKGGGQDRKVLGRGTHALEGREEEKKSKRLSVHAYCKRTKQTWNLDARKQTSNSINNQ